MKYLLLTMLLLSCSGRSAIKLDPVVESTIIQDTSKPSFVLGMPFEGGTKVEPVKSMPVWVPVVDRPKIVKANLKEKYVEYDSLFSENIIRPLEKLNSYDSQVIRFDKIDSMLKIVQKRLYEDSVFIAAHNDERKEEFYSFLIRLGILVIAAMLIAA